MPPADRRRAAPDPTLQRLLDLAQDASSYLRQHADRGVRVSAALLLAASLAACSGDSEEGEGETDDGLVEPLAEEVRTGLPTTPGRYPLASDSLARDEQGVYYFAWQQPGADGSAAGSPASVSLAQLAPAERDELEVTDSGDPILHLREDTAIPLLAAASLIGGGLAAPTPAPTYGSGGGSSSSVHWYPFYGGTVSRGPAYYNPPADAPISTRGTVEGARVSTSPPPAADRVAGLRYAVSGQSRGTGGGTAATLKSGAQAARGPGAATSKSSGFSRGGGGGFFGGSS